MIEKKFTQQSIPLEESQNRFNLLSNEIAELNTAITNLDSRISSTTAKIGELQEAESQTKTKRGSALAKGSDANELSKSLKITRDNIELLQDELTGLKSLHFDKSRRLKEAKVELADAKFQIAKRKYFEALDEYNRRAAEIAKHIEHLFTCQLEYCHAGWTANGAYPDVFTERHYTHRGGDIFQSIPVLSPRITEQKHFWRLNDWARTHH